jgi:heme-degrading monooxygenase HmoA
MIVERATFHIREGQEAAFEAAFDEARLIVAGAPGLHSVRRGRGVEEPQKYLVLVEWDSVADHERFRESELFGGWAQLLHPHYAAMPEGEYYDVVD